jgi:hypothetical protein
VLGRRHGETTSGSRGEHRIKLGRVLAGFVGFFSENGEDIVDLRLVTIDREAGDERVSFSPDCDRVGSQKVSATPGAVSQGFDGRFHGVSIFLLVLVNRS